MRILFLAPLPPPFNGQSIASRVLLDGLSNIHDVDSVDIGRDSQHFGGISLKRIRAVANVLTEVWMRQRRAEAVYLTIAESPAGNLKDVLIYACCFRRLRRTVLHLHGGSIGKLVFERHPMLRRLNQPFLRRMGGVVVSGRSHVGIFDGLVGPERIHAIPNFAEAEMFVAPATIERKFSSPRPLRLAFVSSMIPGKGCFLLAEAILALEPSQQEQVVVDFAGKFESETDRAAFLSLIEGRPHLRYHGIVDADAKRRLFAEAHLFCLPTTYAEGQPISILEAYASGCVVMTTPQPGILDIFTPGKNGYVVQPGSMEAIRDVVASLLGGDDELVGMARHNRQIAETSFTTARFVESLDTVLKTTQTR